MSNVKTIDEFASEQGPMEQIRQQSPVLLSIRTRILTFALLATLIPTLIMGWVSYRYSRSSVEESIEQEFQSATNHISREIELWLRERLYDARVFAHSYVITENLQQLTNRNNETEVLDEAERFLTMYLRSIQEKFPNYEELLILDKTGQLVASNLVQADNTSVPEDWHDFKKTRERMLGQAVIDKAQTIPTMLVGSLILDSNQEMLGIFAISVSLRGIARILHNHYLSQTGHIYLIDKEGLCLVSGAATAIHPLEHDKLNNDTLDHLNRNQGKPFLYQSFGGNEVIGTLVEIPLTEWAILAEKTTGLAFQKLQQLKKAALLIVFAILIIIGTLGSLLSLTIVRPIKRLISGAGEVAGGDLTVDLPPQGPEEIVYLTRMFNEMVRRLRFNHAQLEYLSVTDSLTGLFNRKHLMQSLRTAVTSAEKENKTLSIIMIDIDSFKLFNDTHGHQAGDEILIQVVAIIKASIKDSDFPARYGGDEFLIMLPETTIEESLDVAETIRSTIEKSRFLDGCEEGPLAATVSIGVSGYPIHGTMPKFLIRAADDALYRAKGEGRNRVILAKIPTFNNSMAID